MLGKNACENGTFVEEPNNARLRVVVWMRVESAEVKIEQSARVELRSDRRFL